MKLSIVIPVYNEKKTILEILAAVRGVVLPEKITEKEIILVDDCSTDGTRGILKEVEKNGSSQPVPPWAGRLEPTIRAVEKKETGEEIVGGKKEDWEIKVFYHRKNQGKGAALRTGFEKATGDIVIIQDADLEYDPQEYPKLLQPILDDRADVVYGSRFIGGQSHRVLYFWHYAMNKLLTLLSNVFSDLNLTDMETCYKVFRKSVLEQIKIQENRFGFEPEITAKVGALFRSQNVRVYEVGISYYGRTYADGKKIGWKDGVWALWCVVKYNIKERMGKK